MGSLSGNEYDILVIGGGIAGMEAATALGDMGFSVVLVEKEPSIGGLMISLSKVFPTTDCASCISSPKVSTVAHHQNIRLMTYSEVLDVRKENGEFKAKVKQKARFVHPEDCTGCLKCEQACPVIVPHEFNQGFVGRKAAYVPFDTAYPRSAVIDLDNCIFCGACERVCPTNAIDFLQKDEEEELSVKTVLITTGGKLFPMEKKKEFGYKKISNVINGLQMERLLAPTRPFNTVLRPSDGRIPGRIGYVLCAGSRDASLGNPYCSRICCMYSIKQAILLMGALPLVDVTIHYMDIRAFGKGYEEFYRQAVEMGVQFVRGRVAELNELENGDVLLKSENTDTGQIVEEKYDMVVLAAGLLPETHNRKALGTLGYLTDSIGFIQPQADTIGETEVSEGVFAAGISTGPKDIVDTIAEADAAASSCASYMKENFSGKKAEKILRELM